MIRSIINKLTGRLEKKSTTLEKKLLNVSTIIKTLEQRSFKYILGMDDRSRDLLKDLTVIRNRLTKVNAEIKKFKLNGYEDRAEVLINFINGNYNVSNSTLYEATKEFSFDISSLKDWETLLKVNINEITLELENRSEEFSELGVKYETQRKSTIALTSDIRDLFNSMNN